MKVKTPDLPNAYAMFPTVTPVGAEPDHVARELFALHEALTEWRCRMDDRRMVHGLPWQLPYTECANRHTLIVAIVRQNLLAS